jgi:hypothetical protein
MAALGGRDGLVDGAMIHADVRWSAAVPGLRRIRRADGAVVTMNDGPAAPAARSTDPIVWPGCSGSRAGRHAGSGVYVERRTSRSRISDDGSRSCRIWHLAPRARGDDGHARAAIVAVGRRARRR